MHGHLNVKGTVLVPKCLERIIQRCEVIPQKKLNPEPHQLKDWYFGICINFKLTYKSAAIGQWLSDLMTPFKLQRYLIWFYHGMNWKESISWLKDIEKRSEISNMTVGFSIWAVYTVSYFVLCRIHCLKFISPADRCQHVLPKRQYLRTKSHSVMPKVFTDIWKLQMLLLLSRPRIETVISRVRVRCITVRSSVGYSRSKTPLTAGLFLRHSFGKKVTVPIVNTVCSFLLISLGGRDVSQDRTVLFVIQ